MEGSTRFAIVSREKKNTYSQSKFCRNIVYISSIARDFSFHFMHVLPKFGSRQSENGVTSLWDSHAHVLAISNFGPYEYKQALSQHVVENKVKGKGVC